MRRTTSSVIALVAGVLLLAGCSDGGGDALSPRPSATATSTSDPTSAGPATSPPASSAAPSETASATPTPTGPSTNTPTSSPTSSTTTAAGARRGLRSARADARTIAPQLQAYFDEREYPADRAQLMTTLGDAGVTLSSGNTIGGYGLAGSGVDFVLCVQHGGGGWASFDTAAGKVDDSGTTGSCPAD